MVTLYSQCCDYSQAMVNSQTIQNFAVNSQLLRKYLRNTVKGQVAVRNGLHPRDLSGVLLTVRSRRYPPTAGDSIITKENEAYGTHTQPQHIVTAANVAYGQVGGIPTVQNMASTPASVVDILTTQDKTYGSVSGGVVNTDTEGYEYDYVDS